MRALTDCLQSILQENASSADASGMVTLRATREEGAPPMVVEVRSVASTVTVIDLDKTSQHSLLRPSPGKSWMRICDYVLIEEGEHGCEVVMVELKSTLGTRTAGLEQLRRSLPLAKYLLAVCEVELRRSWPCQFKYALIAEKRTDRLDKQPTRPRPRADVEAKDYEDIRVSIGVGTRFDFSALRA